MSRDVRIQLSRTGTIINRDPAVIAAAKAEFDATHVLKLPAFVDAALLAELQRHIETGTFQVREHKASGTEMCMVDNAAVWLLGFLIASADVLAAIEALTGMQGLKSLYGRVYRLEAGTDQQHDWHNDIEEHRRLGFSLNVSNGVFEGGGLQLRELEPERITATVFNTTPGDAVIFRLHRNVQHRVHPITGTVARTALAGWLRSGDDLPTLK
jgi:hypothetical protein